jgi:hypothetical protein
MDTSEEWTFFWCLAMVVVAGLFAYFMYLCGEETKFAMEHNYVQTTLQGREGSAWVKGDCK